MGRTPILHSRRTRKYMVKQLRIIKRNIKMRKTCLRILILPTYCRYQRINRNKKDLIERKPKTPMSTCNLIVSIHCKVFIWKCVLIYWDIFRGPGTFRSPSICIWSILSQRYTHATHFLFDLKICKKIIKSTDKCKLSNGAWQNYRIQSDHPQNLGKPKENKIFRSDKKWTAWV